MRPLYHALLCLDATTTVLAFEGYTMAWNDELVTAASRWFFSPDRKMHDAVTVTDMVALVTRFEHAVWLNQVDSAPVAQRAAAFIAQAHQLVQSNQALKLEYAKQNQRWSVERIVGLVPQLMQLIADPNASNLDAALTSWVAFERRVVAGELADDQAKAVAQRYCAEQEKWFATHAAVAERKAALARRLTLEATQAAVHYLRRAKKEAGSDAALLQQWAGDYRQFERKVEQQEIELGPALAIAKELIDYAHAHWLKSAVLSGFYAAAKKAGERARPSR